MITQYKTMLSYNRNANTCILVLNGSVTSCETLSTYLASLRSSFPFPLLVYLSVITVQMFPGFMSFRQAWKCKICLETPEFRSQLCCMCHLCNHRQSIYALSLHFCICEVEIIFTTSTLGMIKGRYVFNVWHINAKKEKKSFTTLSLICYNFTIINPPWITCLSIAVVLTTFVSSEFPTSSNQMLHWHFNLNESNIKP